MRGMVFLKQHGAGWMQSLAVPFKVTGLFFIRFVGIPSYRVVFFVRRYIQKVLLPAKHRLVYLVSNRYTMHVMMSCIVIGVMWVNLSARDVRAEDFGQKSLLYQLVSEDDSSILEVVEAGSTTMILGTSSSYVSGTVVDAHRQIDLDFLEETATSEVGDEETTPTVEVPERTSIETYVVQEGDTLGRIAESYGLSLSTILWSNGLSYTSTIRPGQELSILPVDGVLYTVRSGDTLSRIARNYSVDLETVMAQNGLESANRLAIGDKLLLPGGEPPSPVSTSRSSASITTLFTAPSVSAPSTAVDGWIWPTDWHTITQYYGWRHTGVDIDGDYTTSSYAARDGVVIYSGWRSGYGLTVEVDHGDGYVTRYAHHSKNYVAVGDVVSTGQVLAQTGTTGRSTGTHLHFEVIRNGKFQNPLDYVR
ncbi:M23 family metallopeptidase [Candidatus Uhrbacteria bacterium]|nr:M23 family metallopeptidase [Candidatus Uhrbacteria bacterium]